MHFFSERCNIKIIKGWVKSKKEEIMKAQWNENRLTVKNATAQERKIIQANLNTCLDWVKVNDNTFFLYGVSIMKAKGFLKSLTVH